MNRRMRAGEPDEARNRLAVRGLLLAASLVVACLVIIAVQIVVAFRSERSAVARLKGKGNARFANARTSFRGEDGVAWDWSELRNGRVFLPVDSVMIDDAYIDQESADSIASFAHLETLHLRNCELATDQTLLSRLPRLRMLWLTRASLQPRELHEIPKLGQLQCLSLEGDAGQDDLIVDCVTAHPNLAELNLRGLHLSDRAIQQLGAMTKLEWLGLARCNFDLDRLLDVGGKLQQVRTLHLSSTCVDDRFFQRHTFPGLVYVNLSDCNVTDDSLHSLACNTNLIDLDLKNTRITDDGVCHLTALPKLAAVNLEGTLVTNASREVLQAIPTLDWKSVVLPPPVHQRAEN
jgi:hypothetical protein